MLNNADRNTLRGELGRLRRWETEIPRDAVAFHQERSELLDQVEDALKLRGMFTSGETVTAIVTSLERIEPVAASLAQLFARKVVVEHAIEELRSAAPALPDDAIAQYLDGRRAEWRAELVRYGRHVRRQADLAEDLAAIERVAGLVRETHEALKLLIEANRRRQELADEPVRIAAVAARFEGWKLRFRQEGATSALLADIEECLNPLRLRPARKVEDVPIVSLSEVRTLIFQSQRWSSVLHDKGAVDVERMDRELSQIETDWTASRLPTLQQLEADARQFLDEARAEGQAIRVSILGRLQDGLRHLRAASSSRGPDVGQLEKEIEELTSIATESPDGFSDWLHRSTGIEEYLANFATSRRDGLVKLLVDGLAAALKRIGALPAARLTHKLEVDLKLIETRLMMAQKAASGYALDQLFRALTEVDHDVQAIKHIEEQSERDRQALEDRRVAEMERYQRLRTGALTVEASVADLGPELTTVITDAPTFDRGAARLTELGGLITASTNAFIDHCSRDVNDLMAACRRHEDVLGYVTESPIVSVPALTVAAGDSPAEAAGALRAARTHREGLTARLAQAVQQLCTQHGQALADVDDWLSMGEALAPGDRTAAEELKANLAAPVDTASDGGVRALYDVIARYDRLHERVKGEQFVARRRTTHLKSRLQALSEEGLMQFDPQVTARCFGLIDAVPFATQQWPLIMRQIKEATRLLDRLEAQGRRLAARDVEASYAALTRDAYTDPVQARRVHHVLAELQPYLTARTLAPLALRVRARRLAEVSEHTAHV